MGYVHLSVFLPFLVGESLTCGKPENGNTGWLPFRQMENTSVENLAIFITQQHCRRHHRAHEGKRCRSYMLEKWEQMEVICASFYLSPGSPGAMWCDIICRLQKKRWECLHAVVAKPALNGERSGSTEWLFDDARSEGFVERNIEGFSTTKS